MLVRQLVIGGKLRVLKDPVTGHRVSPDPIQIQPKSNEMDVSSEIDQAAIVQQMILEVLKVRMPSAHELLVEVENQLGMAARLALKATVELMAGNAKITRAIREYLASLLQSGELAQALRGEGAPDREMISTIDLLVQQSLHYRKSSAFQEMIEFMGRFRDYAPYNNMLVRIQNPSCGYFATANDWQIRFDRKLKRDARPMLILAPMHPVMLVYDLDQTEGKAVPEELLRLSDFEGEWNPDWLGRLLDNAAKYRILVEFKPLSSTHSGFAATTRGNDEWKMRIAIHDALNEPSRCGVLCHELAHILLGHLGTDADHWWSSRTDLPVSAFEVEAEAVAWLVTKRLGLQGTSEAFVSRYIRDGQTPVGVSPDSIAKVAGLIERMATEALPPRRPRAKRNAKK